MTAARRRRGTLTAGALAVPLAAGTMVWWAVAGLPPPVAPLRRVVASDPAAAVAASAVVPPEAPWERALRAELFPAPPPPTAAAPASPPAPVGPPPAVTLLGLIADGGDPRAVLRAGSGPGAGVEIRRPGEELENLPGVRLEAIAARGLTLRRGVQTFRLTLPAAAAPFANAAADVEE